MGGSQNPGSATVENRRAGDLPGPGAVQQQREKKTQDSMDNGTRLAPAS